MQFQSDILGVPVERPHMIEATAKGAAYLAGLAVDIWGSVDELASLGSSVDVFNPKMNPDVRAELINGWRSALGKTLFQ